MLLLCEIGTPKKKRLVGKPRFCGGLWRLDSRTRAKEVPAAQTRIMPQDFAFVQLSDTASGEGKCSRLKKRACKCFASL